MKSHVFISIRCVYKKSTGNPIRDLILLHVYVVYILFIYIHITFNIIWIELKIDIV